MLILYPLVNTRAAPEGKRGNGTRCHIACFHRGDNEKDLARHGFKGYVCFTGGIWRAGALPLRGQQEALVKEVSRKLFSSEQASDGREAHRGSVSGSEHSWAVQAPPAAPAAVGDVWFGISVSHTKCLHV